MGKWDKFRVQQTTAPKSQKVSKQDKWSQYRVDQPQGIATEATPPVAPPEQQPSGLRVTSTTPPALKLAQPAIQAGYKLLPEKAQRTLEDVAGGAPLFGQILADIGARKALGPLPIPAKGKRFLYGASGVLGALGGERYRQMFEEVAKGKTLLPEERGKKFLKVGKQAAAAEAVGWGLEKAFTPIWRATKGRLPFIKNVRHAFFDAKRKAGKAFEKGLKGLEKKYPDVRIDLSETIQNFKNLMPENPSIVTNIKAGSRRLGDDLLPKLIDDPALAKTLTLNQARTIRRTIQNAPQISTNLKKGKLANWQPAHFDLLDFADDVKANIAANFPDIKGVNAAYSEVVNKYNIVKNKLKPGTLGRQLDTGLKEVEIFNDFVKPLLKDNPQMLRQLSSYFRTRTAGRIAKRFLPLAGAVGLSALGIKSLAGRGQGGGQE